MGRVEVGGCSCVGGRNHGGSEAAMERDESDHGGCKFIQHLFVEPPLFLGMF